MNTIITSSAVKRAAAAVYSGFIFLQCPHPASVRILIDLYIIERAIFMYECSANMVRKT